MPDDRALPHLDCGAGRHAECETGQDRPTSHSAWPPDMLLPGQEPEVALPAFPPRLLRLGRGSDVPQQTGAPVGLQRRTRGFWPDVARAEAPHPAPWA